jgi:amino acid permease
VIPAIFFVALLGTLSAYTFGLYGRVVHATQAKSLGELWEKLQSKSSAWVVSLANLTFCFGAALSASIFLGDVFPSLAQAAGLSGLGTSRSLWIVIVALTTLLPICSLKSLAALAPLSLLGIFGTLLTVGFVGWRCPTLNAASPYSAVGGPLLASLATHQLPHFNTFSKAAGHPASLIFGGMAASAFVGHFSAPDFYHSVRRKDASANKALDDFLKVTVGAFPVVILVNCLVLVFGFLTFGGNSSGFILNNYSNLDPFASLCRLLMAICVIGGYPFLVGGCKSEVVGLLKSKTNQEPSEKTKRTITRTLVALLAGGTLLLKDAGFVIGFNGSVMGSAILFIFPSLLFLSHTGKMDQLPRRLKLERWFCRFLVGFGTFLAAAGGTVCVVNSYFPRFLQ